MGSTHKLRKSILDWKVFFVSYPACLAFGTTLSNFPVACFQQGFKTFKNLKSTFSYNESKKSLLWPKEMLLCNSTRLGMEGFKSICPWPDGSHTRIFSCPVEPPGCCKTFLFPYWRYTLCRKKKNKKFVNWRGRKWRQAIWDWFDLTRREEI